MGKLEGELQKRKSEILAHKVTKSKEFEEKAKGLTEFRLKEAQAKHTKEMEGIDSSIRVQRDRLLGNFEREMTSQREKMLEHHDNIKQGILRKKNDLQSKATR